MRRSTVFDDRVLSGMRPTGRMHIGHYHGALKNWLRLQEEHECLYFAADWHALTTHYETPERIEDSVWEMFIDWLAVGINPNRATIFIQSRVIEHAELTLLLGMIAPVGWLERVPTYKEQIAQIENRDLASSTHFFHDLGHGNLLAFFDFPEDPMPPTREAVGGMHHVSISVPRDQLDRIRGELDKRGIEYFGPDRVENSLYFKGPDGELLEIEADPLEVMEGRPLAQ